MFFLRTRVKLRWEPHPEDVSEFRCISVFLQEFKSVEWSVSLNWSITYCFISFPSSRGLYAEGFGSVDCIASSARPTTIALQPFVQLSWLWQVLFFSFLLN